MKLKIEESQYIDLDDLEEVLNKKYHPNYLSDLHQYATHYDRWCISKKYGKNEKQRIFNKKWTKEYKVDPKGLKSAPEALSFLDLFEPETSYGKEEFDLYIDFKDNDLPDWAQEPFDAIMKEIKKLIKDQTSITLRRSW